MFTAGGLLWMVALHWWRPRRSNAIVPELLPPRLAPYQVVMVPIYKKEEEKSAVLAAVNKMQAELVAAGIRVNTIAPGYIKTEMAAANPDEGIEGLFASRTPLGRVGYPDDIQGIAVYLTSDLSSFHSGDTILIDGAMGVTLV